MFPLPNYHKAANLWEGVWGRLETGGERPWKDRLGQEGGLVGGGWNGGLWCRARTEEKKNPGGEAWSMFSPSTVHPDFRIEEQGLLCVEAR